jgi:hippurate hydrolase
MVTALQTFVTRRFDIHDPVVLTVGIIQGGTKRNVIPDHAGFEATVRTFSRAARERVREGTATLFTGIAAAHGLTVDITFHDGYPALVNDPAEVALAESTVTDLFGAQRLVRTPAPTPGAEDMAFVMERVPGAFLMLGACPPERDWATVPQNHSAQAVFDDAVLPDGAALLAELALRRLRLAPAQAPAGV